MAGYGPRTFYNRIKGKQIPKEGNKYLVDDSTVSALFGIRHGRRTTSQASREEPAGKSIDGLAAKYHGQIDSEKLAKVLPLRGRYIDGPTICKIAGYGRQGLYGRVEKGVPSEGRKSGKKYLINDQTIPILFGKGRIKAQVEPERKPGNARKMPEQREVTRTPRRETRGASTNGTGDYLTFDGMISYVGQRVGEDGEARALAILGEYGDDVQVGHDKFSKAKLDEILGKHS